MAILRLPGKELDKLCRDLDHQIEKLEFEFTVTRNLLRILKKANESRTNQNNNSGRPDSMGEAGTE